MKRRLSTDDSDSETLDLTTCRPRSESLMRATGPNSPDSSLASIDGYFTGATLPGRDFGASSDLGSSDADVPATTSGVHGPPCSQKGLHPTYMVPTDLDYKPACGWQQNMLRWFGPRFTDAVFQRKVKLVTCCSGTGAPRIALDLLGFPVEELCSVDPKTACVSLLRNSKETERAHHHFAIAEQLVQNQGFCFVHESLCFLEPTREDLFVAGFPCAPFSTARPARWQSGGWRDHPEAKIMFEVAESMTNRMPLLAVLENVPGFLRQSRQRQSHVHFIEFHVVQFPKTRVES